MTLAQTELSELHQQTRFGLTFWWLSEISAPIRDGSVNTKLVGGQNNAQQQFMHFGVPHCHVSMSFLNHITSPFLWDTRLFPVNTRCGLSPIVPALSSATRFQALCSMQARVECHFFFTPGPKNDRCPPGNFRNYLQHTNEL